MISHGSGGGPWVHMDLARRLVQAGFVVAIPLHKGDNHQDDGTTGPQSWERRPAEVSAAIDAVAAQPRLDRPRTHYDPRIAAAVSAVPAAADFDMRSLERPRVPLGLVLSGQDRWLTPRWHGERVSAACQTCELLARLPQGGHSIGLSPLPPGLQGLEARLLNDPPGFDRATELPKVDARIVDFFSRHLGLR